MQLDNITVFSSLLILLSPYLLRKSQSLSSLQGLVTTFGILGTFIGIFLGLVNFNATDIYGSVPKLLEGLKTAFLTSIAGMVAGLLLKLAPQIYLIKVDEGDRQKEEASIESMISLLNSIQKGICGEGETTLLTQIQKLRTTFSDKQDELNQSFREFANKVVQDGTQSLVDALTQVMRDFNTRINEQFGDNFRQLNEAVGKMLDWQKEYANRVEQMTEQFERTLEGVTRCEQILSNISDRARVFSEVSLKLNDILIALDQERQNLDRSLGAFAGLANRAESTFPIIHTELNRLTQDLRSTVEHVVRENARLTDEQREGINRQTIIIQETHQRLGDQVSRIVGDLNTRIERLMQDNANRITQQLTELDRQLGEELSQSLRTLGSQLASLSQKFVQDYAPLTDRLKEVVNMSRNI